MGRVTATSALVLGVLAALSGAAHADDGVPLAVTVESADARLGARAVRQAVARVLTVPVVSLLDSGVEGTRGTLAVVVARGGRAAQLFFQAKAGRRQLSHVVAPAGERGASWIAVAVAEFLRGSLDDRWSMPSEVLDPFDGGTATPSAATSEVIDPWAQGGSGGGTEGESGAALGRPHPR